MFRKKLAEKYYIYRKTDFPQDYELVLRLLSHGVRISKLPDPLYQWKDSRDRIKTEDENYIDLAFYEIKTYYLFCWLNQFNPFHPTVVVWGAGRTARKRFALLKELGIESKFFIDLRANPDFNVIEYTRTPPAGRFFIVCYTVNPEARDKIREFLTGINYLEGKNLICFA